MAITATQLLSTGTGAGDASTQNADLSRALASNTLGLAAVFGRHGTDSPEPTLTGGGVTWVNIGSSVSNNGIVRTTVFRAMHASPSGTTLTADWGGVTQTGWGMHVTEFAGVDTSGTNGSGAVVQVVTPAAPGNVTGLSLTLATLGNAANATYGAFGHAANEATTHGTPFTELGDTNFSAAATGIQTEWRTVSATTDTTVDASWASSVRGSGVAVEIKAAAAGGTTVTPSTASLATAQLAPTVVATAHQLVTPSTASLATSRFAATATASDHQALTPSAAALFLSPFAPTVTATAHVAVTPATAALATTTFGPTINVGNAVTVEPNAASLSLSAFASSVATTAHRTVIPAPASLSLAGLAATVTASAHRLVTPGVATLTLAAFAPTLGASVEIDLGSVALSVAVRDGLSASVSRVAGIAAAVGGRDGSSSSTTLRDGLETHHE